MPEAILNHVHDKRLSFKLKLATPIALAAASQPCQGPACLGLTHALLTHREMANTGG